MEFLKQFNDGVPFHPALVHLPLGIAMLLPLLALAATVAIRKGWVSRKAWWGIVGLQVMMLGGAFAAYNTGQKEKDLVGGIVDDAPIEAHEEAAEQFFIATGALLAVSIGAAMVPARRAATGAHLLVTGLSALLLLMGARVGHLGGRLVYVHNAAQAHLPENTGAEPAKKGDEGGQGSEGEDEPDD